MEEKNEENRQKMRELYDLAWDCVDTFVICLCATILGK